MKKIIFLGLAVFNIGLRAETAKFGAYYPHDDGKSVNIQITDAKGQTSNYNLPGRTWKILTVNGKKEWPGKKNYVQDIELNIYDSWKKSYKDSLNSNFSSSSEDEKFSSLNKEKIQQLNELIKKLKNSKSEDIPLLTIYQNINNSKITQLKS